MFNYRILVRSLLEQLGGQKWPGTLLAIGTMGLAQETDRRYGVSAPFWRIVRKVRLRFDYGPF